PAERGFSADGKTALPAANALSGWGVVVDQTMDRRFLWRKAHSQAKAHESRQSARLGARGKAAGGRATEANESGSRNDRLCDVLRGVRHRNLQTNSSAPVGEHNPF